MALRPDLVGTRVVVRRLLPGQTGPTGGPAFSDVLGRLTDWSADELTVQRADGTAVRIAQREVVTAKPVPPRGSTRSRISAEQACRLSNASWPAVHEESLGAWMLRASGGFSARANSVMAVGDPGLRFDEALAAVRAYYAAHFLPAWAQVVVGSGQQQAFERAGWVSARPGEDDSEFHLVSIARAGRAARSLLPPGPPGISIEPTAGPTWLADDERARRHRDDALRVLEGPEQVGFAAIAAIAASAASADALRAKGRVAVHGDWAGITDVWVAPQERRQGLALVVMEAMLAWAAERGALTAYLQVRGDNPGALALYERLGFTVHHRYRYLTAPD